MVYGVRCAGTWGANTKGQCGLGTNVDVPAPKQVTATFKAPVQKVVCGRSHIVALTEDGNVFSTLHKPDTEKELEHEQEKVHESEALAVVEHERDEAKAKAAAVAAAALKQSEKEKAAALAAAAKKEREDARLTAEEDEKIGTFVHLKPRAIFHDISAGLDTVGLSMSGVIYFWNTRNGQTIEKLSTLEGVPTQSIAAGDLHYALIAALPHGVHRTAEETAASAAHATHSGGDHPPHPHPHPHHHPSGTVKSSGLNSARMSGGALPSNAGGSAAAAAAAAAMGSARGSARGLNASSSGSSLRKHSSLDMSNQPTVNSLAELSAALAQVARKSQKTPEPAGSASASAAARGAGARRGSQPALESVSRSPPPAAHLKSSVVASSARRGSHDPSDAGLTPAQLKQLANTPLGGGGTSGRRSRRGSTEDAAASAAAAKK